MLIIKIRILRLNKERQKENVTNAHNKGQDFEIK